MQLRLSDGVAASIVSSEDTGEEAEVYNFEVDGWHTYHVGELGVWVHNHSCYEAILLRAGQAKPLDMIRPHAHHILFRNGLGKTQKALVERGKAVFERFGIDMDSPVNMTWAPNGRGVHKTSSLRALVDDLERAAPNGPDAVKESLQVHGQRAFNRGFDQ